jgi:hypothetical protein
VPLYVKGPAGSTRFRTIGLTIHPLTSKKIFLPKSHTITLFQISYCSGNYKISYGNLTQWRGELMYPSKWFLSMLCKDTFKQLFAISWFLNTCIISCKFNEKFPVQKILLTGKTHSNVISFPRARKRIEKATFHYICKNSYSSSPQTPSKTDQR